MSCGEVLRPVLVRRKLTLTKVNAPQSVEMSAFHAGLAQELNDPGNSEMHWQIESGCSIFDGDESRC